MCNNKREEEPNDQTRLLDGEKRQTNDEQKREEGENK